QGLGTAILDIVVNLYLLDHIPRRQLNQFEPRRLLFAGTAFALGPWAGVYLDSHVAVNLPYVVAALAPLSLPDHPSVLRPRPPPSSWPLRLAETPGRQAAGAPPPNPLKFVPRFLAQPRLVLSWVLAFGRTGWWTTNFIYTPIYVTLSGYAPEVGGALVSLGL